MSIFFKTILRDVLLYYKLSICCECKSTILCLMKIKRTWCGHVWRWAGLRHAMRPGLQIWSSIFWWQNNCNNIVLPIIFSQMTKGKIHCIQFHVALFILQALWLSVLCVLFWNVPRFFTEKLHRRQPSPPTSIWRFSWTKSICDATLNSRRKYEFFHDISWRIFLLKLQNLVLKFHAKLAKSLVRHRHPSLQVVAALFLIRERHISILSTRNVIWKLGGGGELAPVMFLGEKSLKISINIFSILKSSTQCMQIPAFS